LDFWSAHRAAILTTPNARSGSHPKVIKQFN
jgi:hypothetical protein